MRFTVKERRVSGPQILGSLYLFWNYYKEWKHFLKEQRRSRKDFDDESMTKSLFNVAVMA